MHEIVPNIASICGALNRIEPRLSLGSLGSLVFSSPCDPENEVGIKSISLGGEGSFYLHWIHADQLTQQQTVAFCDGYFCRGCSQVRFK